MSSDLGPRIDRLKRDRKAVILAHNYQPPEVQEIADYSGDSLGLSRRAAETDAEVIVFCGVHFMAETAAILCPGRRVLMPDPRAGCPMADMITADQLREFKAQHPAAAVVCYVNSTAEVKSESDICCTSSNAVQVVESLDGERQIIFVPDQNLGLYVQQQTGREMVLWPGYCPTHAWIQPQHIKQARAEHPGALVMAHPECRPAVTALADRVLSTGGMCRYASSAPPGEYIVATEKGLLHRLRRENPESRFYPAADVAVCPNMKRTNLEKILWSLQDMQHPVVVEEAIAGGARKAIERMLEISGQ